MHVPIVSTDAASTTKTRSLGYVVLLAGTTAISGFLFGLDTAVRIVHNGRRSTLLPPQIPHATLLKETGFVGLT